MKKISKEEWNKLSPDQKLLVQYNFDAAKFRLQRVTLAVSRLLALLLILAIFWVGFAQIAYVNDIRDLQEDQGNNIWCYKCGQDALRKCDCTYYDENTLKNMNITKVGQELADYNTKACAKTKTGFDMMNDYDLSDLENLTLK